MTSSSDLPRSERFELVADIGNGVKVELYFPEHATTPTWWVRQNGYPAPLCGLDDVRKLRDALNGVLGD